MKSCCYVICAQTDIVILIGILQGCKLDQQIIGMRYVNDVVIMAAM
jgi:hypothetical protein